MAVISGTTVAWQLSPRVITIPTSDTSITVEDLQDTLQDLEDDEQGMIWPHLRNTSGGESLGGGTSVGLTMELQNAQVAFSPRTTSLSNGAATTANAAGTVLIDSAATFVTSGILAGATIVNFTDQSVTTVISVDSETQLTHYTLKDGTDNDWDLTDSYKVWNETQCEITGGNTVAVDGVGDAISAISPTFGTQVLKVSSSSATQSDLDAVQYASYSSAVNMQSGSGNTGTTYPTGNVEFPVDNIIDGKAIAVDKGFIGIRVRGDYVFGVADTLESYIYEGDNAAQSTFTFTSGATTPETSFKNACLTGDLSGSLFVEDCALQFLTGVGCTTAISRFINCAFEGGSVTIRADNNKEIHFVSCENAADDAEININGSVADIRMQQYSGDLILSNLTAGNTFIFNTTGGHLTIDASCTNGTVILQGDAKYENNGTVTIEDETSATLANAYLEKSVWIDTEQVAAGEGSQKLPFNTLTAGIDYAEAEGIKTLKIYADIILDRQVKNFTIDGVGQPTIDCSGQTLTKSEFFHCNIEGIALGQITVQQGILLAGFEFNGFVEKSAINDDIIINGPTHIMESYSNKPGAGYANITTGSNILQVSDWHRSLGIKGMTGGTHTIEMYGGQLHLDNTCTGGTIYLRGNYSLPPDDQSAGTTIIDQTENTETWAHTIEGTFTAEEVMRIMSAALAGKASGLATNAPVFRDINDTKDRITATTDASGNRTAVTLVES